MVDLGNRNIMVLISLIQQSVYHKSNYELSNHMFYLEKYNFLKMFLNWGLENYEAVNLCLVYTIFIHVFLSKSNLSQNNIWKHCFYIGGYQGWVKLPKCGVNTIRSQVGTMAILNVNGFHQMLFLCQLILSYHFSSLACLYGGSCWFF